MEVVILDFETTGLSCDRHRVIEIGAVILNREGEVINTFQTLNNERVLVLQQSGGTEAYLDDFTSDPSMSSMCTEICGFFKGWRKATCRFSSS